MLQGVLHRIKGLGWSLEARKLHEELKNSGKVNYKSQIHVFLKYILEDGEEWVVILMSTRETGFFMGKRGPTESGENYF